MNQPRFISKIEIKPRTNNKIIEKRSSNDSGNFDNHSQRTTTNSFLSVGSHATRRKSSISIKTNNNYLRQSWTDNVKCWMNSVQNKFKGPDGKIMDKPRTDQCKELAEFVHESLLCDEGLKEHGYLTLRMVSNEGGWLSIRMLSTIKLVKQKMKSFGMRDWRQLSVALCMYLDEEKYTVTDCGQFVRRMVTIPTEIVEMHKAKKEPADAIIIIGVPSNICRDYVAIKQLTTCKDEGVMMKSHDLVAAGAKLDPKLEKFQKLVPDLGLTDCLVINYANENEAIQAVKHINGRYFGIRAGVLRSNVGDILYKKKLIENDVKNSLVKKLPCCN
jgi:hypothetical protein